MQNRDPEYLDKLRDYYSEHRVLPSFSGVAKLVGLKSTSAVAAMVRRMKDAGFLGSSPDRRLQPGQRFFEREILDTVSAGLPKEAVEGVAEGLNVDAYLIDNPSRTALMKVRGDSMINAGLLPGDTVVVKRGVPSKPGDIVVAIIDREYTIKRLAHDSQGFYLLPENPAYKPIRPQMDLEIFGVVSGCFRKYR